MKVKDDSLQIQSVPYDVETGEKLEPEEVPVQRVLDGGAPVSFQGGDGEVLGHLRSKIIREGDAITFANEAAAQCVRCKHFDQKAFRDWLRSPRGQEHKLALLDGLAQQYQTTIDNPELNFQLNFIGLCRIQTEIDGDVAITRPDYPCSVMVTPATPTGAFDAVTSGDEKISSARYDQILRIAQGNKE